MSLTINPPRVDNPPSSLRVIRQIALFEGRRQLKSPLLWLAVLASLALVWLAVNGEPGTLWARSVIIAGSCSPIAVVALLLGNAAALRDHSFRVGETTEVPPTSRDARMLGLVTGSWVAFLLAVVVVIVGLVLSVGDDPAGSFLLPEVAVGPVLVPLAQALGVVLGRWIPNPLAAPLTLIVIAALFLIQDFWPGERTIPTASPFLPWRQAYTDWVQGEPRLPLVHLAYLIGLVGAFASLAARRWRALAVAGALVAATAVGLAGINTAGEEAAAAVEAWGEDQPRVCARADGVEYCAIEGYKPWIDDWASVVNRIDGLVPGDLRVERVEQTVEWHDFDTDPTIAHVHGRLPADADLTMQVLAPELGLPGTGGEAAAMNSDLPTCMAHVIPVFVSGQARAVAYLVLTERATPGAVATGGFGGTYQLGNLELSEGEADLALQIASRSEEDILAVLHPRWDRLADPAISSATLADWFGLDAPVTAQASSYDSMQCECTGDGGVSCTSTRAP